jgi:hypothetical protein
MMDNMPVQRRMTLERPQNLKMMVDRILTHARSSLMGPGPLRMKKSRKANLQTQTTSCEIHLAACTVQIEKTLRSKMTMVLEKNRGLAEKIEGSNKIEVSRNGW